MENMIISKEDAIKLGQRWFFTGEPCVYGHISRRVADKTNKCFMCRAAYQREWISKNKEKKAKIDAEYRVKNREKCNNRIRSWAEKNRKRSNLIKNNWKKRNKDYFQNYYIEKNKDPLFRVSRNISKALCRWLRGAKKTKHWEDILGFTKEQLIEHLTPKMTKEMTWENYGSYWHIDHIKPKSWCRDIQEIWALSNLQPLEASKNCSKQDRFIG